VDAGVKKKPVFDRLSREPGNNPQSALQRADVLAKPTFMPGSLVLVDQSLADRFVDNRHRFLISGLRSFRISGGYGFNDIFNMGAQHRALAGVALAAYFRLTGTLTGLCRVCQSISPAPGSKEPATMRISRGIVNGYASAGSVS
jgi:hypothetical protein